MINIFPGDKIRPIYHNMPLFHLSRSEEGNSFLLHDKKIFESFLLYIVQKITDFPIFLYFSIES